MRLFSSSRTTIDHPYAWLWEPLEEEPTFFLRSMFGAKAVYLHGKLMVAFVARGGDGAGVLVGIDRANH